MLVQKLDSSLDSDLVLSESDGLLEDHPALTYLAKLNVRSQRTMLTALNAIARLVSHNTQDARSFAWHQIRYTHAIVIRNLLIQQVDDKLITPATANNWLAALRGVLKECWRLNLITADEYQRAIDWKGIKYTALPSGRALSRQEQDALWRSCLDDDRPIARRDLAILTLLLTGPRRAECVALDLADVNATSGEVTIRSGKGRKDRTIYIPHAALPHLQSWVEIRGYKAGPFLLPMLKSGQPAFRRLSEQRMWGILTLRAEQAGIPHVSPHDLRRTFATEAHEQGVDTTIVQRLMGHSNPSTTARYDRRGERAKAEAVNLLHVPKRTSTDLRTEP